MGSIGGSKMKKFDLRKRFIVFLLVLSVAAFSAFIVACSGGKGGGNGGSPSDTNFPIDKSLHIGTLISEDETNASVALSNYSLDLPLYSKSSLSATVFGTRERVIWSSDAENVVSVTSAGLLEAKTIGVANITARAGEVSATCVVTVVETVLSPVIRLSNEVVNISVGRSFEITPSLFWNGEEIDDAEYNVLTESGSDYASAEVVDGKVVVSGLAEGSSVFIVSSHAFDKDVFAKFKVNVSENIVSFLPSGSTSYALSPYGGALITGSYAEAVEVDGKTYGNTVDLHFDKYVDGENQGNAAFTWKFFNVNANNERVYIAAPLGMRIQNGVLTTRICGEYNIEGSVADSNATLTLHVSVSYIGIDVNESKIIEIASLNNESTSSYAYKFKLSDLTYGSNNEAFVEGADTSAIIAYLHGVQVGEYSNHQILFNGYKSAFPSSAKKLGGQTLTVRTISREYYVPVNVYTKIISNKADLDEFKTLSAAAGEKAPNGRSITCDGYFVVDNDIEYNGEFISLLTSYDLYSAASSSGRGQWQNASIYGFKGVFDGQGHTISGLTIVNKAAEAEECGGFIGYIHVDGVIKNVAFTNASVAENCGFICSYGGGLIENIYVQYARLGIGKVNRGFAADSTDGTPRYIGTFYSMLATDTAVVRNCIVDASAADTSKHVVTIRNDGRELDNYVLIGVPAPQQSVVLIMPDESILARSGATYKFIVYGEFDSEKNTIDSNDWVGDFWSVSDPYIYCDAMRREGAIEFTNVASNDDVNVGSPRKIELNKMYFTLSIVDLDPAYDGKVSISADNRLSASAEVPAGTTFKLRAVDFFDDTNAVEAEFTVYPQITDVEFEDVIKFDLDIVKSGDVYSSNSTACEFDLSSVSAYLGTSTYKVMIGEEFIARDVSVVNGKVSILRSSFDVKYYGAQTVDFYTVKGSAVYRISVPVQIVTKTITTAEEFLAINDMSVATGGGGYFELGADIALTNGKGENIFVGGGWGAQPKWSDNRIMSFVGGTIDGNGHTVDNLRLTATAYSGWIEYSENSVIKNIAFTNVHVEGSKALIHSGGVTLENVYVEVACVCILEKSNDDNTAITAVYSSSYGTNIFDLVFNAGSGGCSRPTTLKNVVFDLRKATADYAARGFTGGYVHDVDSTGKPAGYLLAWMSKSNPITFINVVMLGVPDQRLVDKTIIRQDFYPSTYSDGSDAGVYVETDEGNTNRVVFPTDGWDAAYWTVDSVEGTIDWGVNP